MEIAYAIFCPITTVKEQNLKKGIPHRAKNANKLQVGVSIPLPETGQEQKNMELSAMALHIAHKNRMLDSLRLGIQNTIGDYRHETHNLADVAMKELTGMFDDTTVWEAFGKMVIKSNDKSNKKTNTKTSDTEENAYQRYKEILAKRLPLLSNTEIDVVALLRLRLSMYEVAATLNIEQSAVLRLCNTIRTKLRISESEEITSTLLLIV